MVLSSISRLFALAAVVVVVASCDPREPKQPDLPKQPDRWVASVPLGPQTNAKYVGQTRDYIVTSVTNVRDVNAVSAIRVGDKVEGLEIGAIKCSFHWRDASYGREQYMWRGQWACMAGRSREEVENAVADDGTKRFDYIHVTPIRLE